MELLLYCIFPLILVFNWHCILYLSLLSVKLVQMARCIALKERQLNDCPTCQSSEYNAEHTNQGRAQCIFIGRPNIHHDLRVSACCKCWYLDSRSVLYKAILSNGMRDKVLKVWLQGLIAGYMFSARARVVLICQDAETCFNIKYTDKCRWKEGCLW